jgi:4-amino-4-deoxy-L-arabinose transferase-like glycosyltransferase
VLVAFAWRIQGLSWQSLWRDEVDAIFFALRDLPVTLSMFAGAGQNGALYFLSLRPWLRLFGSSEFALRYPSVIFGVLSVPLLWQVSRRLIPAPTARLATGDSIAIRGGSIRAWLINLWQTIIGNPPLLAALFLAASPYQLWYSQEGKMYALITFLSLLAAWFWLDGIGRGGWRPWLGFLVTVSFAIYSHLLMVLLIPLFFIWFVIAWPKSKHHWVGYFLALAALTLPYLPMVWWQWDLLASEGQLTALPFIPFREMIESVLLSQSHSILPPASMLWLVPIFILGAYGLFTALSSLFKRSGDTWLGLAIWRRHLLILSWLIVPLLSIYLLSLRQPLFVPRYVIWIAPAVMMLVALGAHFIWQQRGSVAKVIATVLVIHVIAYWGAVGWQGKTTDIKHDLRSAVRYVSQRRQVDELLIMQIPHLEVAYRYYSSDKGSYPFVGGDERLGWWAAGPWTNNELGDDQARRLVDQEMRDVTAEATDIWVMLSEAESWDERGLMNEWLSQQATLMDAADFHGTQVRYYRIE